MVGWHHQLTDMSWSKFQEFMMDREAWHAAVQGVAESDMIEQLNSNMNNIELIICAY